MTEKIIWNHINVIKLIEAYRDKTILWDHSKKNFYNPIDKRQAWMQISKQLNCPVPEIKKKMSYVLGQLRREKRKRRKCLAEGYREKDILWDQSKRTQYNHVDKAQAWVELSKQVNYPVPEVKKKIAHILSQLRREKHKRRATLEKGEVYTASWYAYDYLSFLIDTSQDNAPSGQKLKAEYVSVYSDDQDKESDDDQMESDDSMPPMMISESDKTHTEKVEIMVEEPSTSMTSVDECQLYANYIASKLRNYSKQTRNVVEHHISNLLFEADSGNFDLKD